MRIFFIFAILLLNVPYTHTLKPDDAYFTQIPSHSIDEQIKKEFYDRLGNGLHKIPANERQNLYTQARNNLFGNKTDRGQAFDKIAIHKAVDATLGNYAVNLMRDVAAQSNKKGNLTLTEAVRRYQETITKECKDNVYGPIFESFTDIHYMEVLLQEYAIDSQREQRIKQATQTNRSWAGAIAELAYYIFLSLESTTYEQPQQNQQSQQHETSHNAPKPSAPTLNVIEGVFPHHECICSDSFKNQETESFFLPCGHNCCRMCYENWLNTHGKKTCPRGCGYTVTTQDRNNLGFAYTITNICALCYKQGNGLSAHLKCGHYLCGPCKNKWCNQQDEEYRNLCPRCFKNVG